MKLARWIRCTVLIAFSISMLVAVACCPSPNQAPTITSLSANPASVAPGGTSTITCIASDPNGDTLNYDWSASDGTISGMGSVVTWVAPSWEGTFIISVTVDDGRGEADSADFNVVASVNNPPVIASLTPSPAAVTPGGSSTITCAASDPDGDTLTYAWTATGGTISGTGSTVTWVAPSVAGTYNISVTVDDGNGGTDTHDAAVVVGGVAGLPDLIVTNIAFDPAAPDVGDTVHVFITIANQGGEVSPVCHWNFAPQTAAEIEDVLPSLGPGASTIVDDHFTCLTAGSWTTVATADSWYEVTESNEGNNGLSAPLTVAAAAPVTVTLGVIAAESGSVFSDGSVGAILWVGDDPPNRGRQAFLSFDISGIPAGATVTDVVVDFSDYGIIGDPFGSMPFDGCLRGYVDDYGTLGAEDYFAGSPTGAILRYCSPAAMDVPASDPDAVSALQGEVGTSRFRLRLQFSPPGTDSDGIQDTVSFGAVELTVTYE